MAPLARSPRWWERFVPGCSARIDLENAQAAERHEESINEWTAAKRDYELRLARRKKLVEVDIYRDIAGMEAWLEEVLQEVIWPRETQVSLEVKGAGKLVMLDVGLPVEQVAKHVERNSP